MRRIALPLIVLILALISSMALAQDTEFQMGNDFYEAKDNASAIRMYESVLAQGGKSPELYYNLGNAHFKDGDLGRAVLYYMKARRMAPDDEDILHNLEFARQFSRVQMEGVELNPIRSFLASLVGPHRLDVLAWIASVFFVILMLILVVRFGLNVNRAWVRVPGVLALILLIAFGGLAGFKYRDDYLTRRAVIVAEESPVLTGDSEQSDVELQGAPGLIVEILSESGDFYNVLFENKRRGWIKKDLVAEI